MLAALACDPAQGSVLKPAPGAGSCDRCNWALATHTDEPFFWQWGEEMVCPLCRYELDPDPPVGDIHLLILPEFSQAEINGLMYTLLKPILAAKSMPQSHAADPARLHAQSLLDALGQRQRDSQDHLPILASLPTLRQALQALPAGKRTAVLEKLSGLRYLPNLENRAILRKLSVIRQKSENRPLETFQM